MGAPDIALHDSSIAVALRRVVSGKGDYEINAYERDKMCFLSDGTLLVASSYKSDHAVLAYQQLLRLKKQSFKIEIVSVEEIKKQYAGAVDGGSQKSTSNVQKDVVALMSEAVAFGASDIHIRNERTSTKIFMRIDGFLQPVHSLKLEDGNAICATMYGTMCDDAEPTYQPRNSQDGTLKQEYVEALGLYTARVATRPGGSSGNLVVVRLLPMHKVLSLESLGYDQVHQIPLIRRMTTRTDGINLFTGPTGSGKSTSLHALMTMLLKHFNHAIHLLTIEDPIESKLHGAVQTPLIYDRSDAEAAERAWPLAITNAMRLDPDTIMVGEMRDRLSALTAFRAAMTGHGVWSTLHTNNCLQSLDRLIDLGIPSYLATDATLITGLVNQSLAAVNCPECKRPYLKHKFDLADDLRERIEKYCDPATVYLRGKDRGCKYCNGKGYKGRTVAAEACLTNQSIMNAYRSGGAAAARSVWVKKFDGYTKNSHLISKINQGLLDPEIAEQKVCPIDYDVLTIE